MRLLPRFNLKREVWPGGPQVGDVIEAQLRPAERLPAPAEEEPADESARNLLLLLR